MQTLACYMKSLWEQFNFCQWLGSTATMDSFYALASDSHQAFCVSWKQSLCKTPFPPSYQAFALKVYFIHIEMKLYLNFDQ